MIDRVRAFPRGVECCGLARRHGKTTTMTTGTVKFFNVQKGFGFIQPEDGSTDVFVHVSALERAGLAPLNDGDKVNFETEIDRRSGKQAVSTISMA